MRKLPRYILSLTLFSVAALSAHAQKARIAGLEQDQNYMQLLEQQEQLKNREDSTVALINNSRQQFESSSDRDKLGQEIVRLEGELFEIRSQIGKITAQVAAIEQEYIVNHMNDPATTQGTAATGGARALFANSFFADNLTQEDLALFARAPRVEPQVKQLHEQIAGLYEQLTLAKGQYDAANDQECIDSLFARAGELKDQIEQVDAQMERLWLEIYDHKLDAYLVLLDKIGTVDRLQLERLDQESRAVRRAEGLAGKQLAPLIATYPLQKQLTLDYEATMAQALGLKAAEDSLKTELGKFSAESAAQEMTYPDIIFAPRNLVVYSAITKTADTTQRNYTTVENVPVLHIPKKGLYYTVQIALYTNPPKSIEAFKGMTPVMYQKTANGQTRYTAGGFATYAEAQEAATQMVRAGFRASVVAFSNGENITATKAKALEAAAREAAEEAAANGFTVEITPAELRLSTAIREAIAEKAPGKTIIRRSSGAEVIYSVGNFATQAEADQLAEALRSQPNVKIKVSAL